MYTQNYKYACVIIRCKQSWIASEKVASSEVFGHSAPKRTCRVCSSVVVTHVHLFFQVGTQWCRKSACMQNGEDCVTKFSHQRSTRSCKTNSKKVSETNCMMIQRHVSLVKGKGLYGRVLAHAESMTGKSEIETQRILWSILTWS